MPNSSISPGGRAGGRGAWMIGAAVNDNNVTNTGARLPKKIIPRTSDIKEYIVSAALMQYTVQWVGEKKLCWWCDEFFLCLGLVIGTYEQSQVNMTFYFDIHGMSFLSFSCVLGKILHVCQLHYALEALGNFEWAP